MTRERAAGARGGMHYLVAGDGPGELFETWAPDPAAAVRAAYEAAGGGGAIFEVVPGSVAARSGCLAVYAGYGAPIFDRRVRSETRERARALLVRLGRPLVRVRAVAEAPMVVVAIQSAAVIRAWRIAGERKEGALARYAELAAALSAVVAPHPGTVAVDVAPGDPDGPFLKVHARGLPLFRLMRLTAALEAAAAAAVLGGAGRRTG